MRVLGEDARVHEERGVSMAERKSKKIKKSGERPTSCSFIIPMLSHQDGIRSKYSEPIQSDGPEIEKLIY